MQEVLRIFLKSDKQDSDDELGSGSGDDEISPGGGGPDDEDSGKPTLLGASRTVAPLRTQSHSKNKAANTGGLVRSTDWEGFVRTLSQSYGCYRQVYILKPVLFICFVNIKLKLN